VFGCCAGGDVPPSHEVEAQLESAVDLFLHGYRAGARR